MTVQNTFVSWFQYIIPFIFENNKDVFLCYSDDIRIHVSQTCSRLLIVYRLNVSRDNIQVFESCTVMDLGLYPKDDGPLFVRRPEAMYTLLSSAAAKEFPSAMVSEELRDAFALLQAHISTLFETTFHVALVVFAVHLRIAQRRYISTFPVFGTVMCHLCYRDRVALSLVCRETYQVFSSDLTVHTMIVNMRRLYNENVSLLAMFANHRRCPEFLGSYLARSGEIFEFAEWYCVDPTAPKYLFDFPRRRGLRMPKNIRKDAPPRRSERLAKRVKPN